MSVYATSYLTNDKVDDTDISKDLRTFCMKLTHQSQWKGCRHIFCGSYVELPGSYARAKQIFDVKENLLDHDLMIYGTDIYAFHRSASIPDTYTGNIIRIYTDDVHIGYARLIKEEDNKELLLRDIHTLRDDEEIHGPAVLTKNCIKATYSLSNLRNDASIWDEHKIPYRDLVYAVHTPYWPVEAIEWITRLRCRGFPSKSVIKQVVRYGCDFVQVSHNRLSYEGEWRFSFSKAELFIIKSWTVLQKSVYSTLWMLNKRVASSHLCSYYFKTLMFWACEEKPAQFWYDNLLVQSVYELLVEMMKCVKSKFCVNYFIPGNNMMDHLIDTDLSYEIDTLWRISQSYQFIVDITKDCHKIELIFPNQLYDIESEAWILRAFIIYQHLNNQYDNFVANSCKQLEHDFRNAVYVELSDIYRGIFFQQKSFRYFNVSEKYIYFLKSENHFFRAVQLCESQKCQLLKNCPADLVRLLPAYYRFCSYNAAAGSSENINKLENESTFIGRQNLCSVQEEQKRLLYSRLAEAYTIERNGYTNERIVEKKKINIVTYRNIALFHMDSNKLKTHKHSGDGHIYKEWPGQSPTVNISWFIAKAYLANLYHTTQSNASLIIKTCNDIIEVSKQSMINEATADQTFPFVLSTQWTSIYDKEIQELLGFYSLCSYVFDASTRSVDLGVCPILFARYLTLRTAIRYSVEFNRRTKYPHEFDEHLGRCKYMRSSQMCMMTNAILRILLRKQKMMDNN